MTTQTDHQSVIELLPWFVKGTLKDEERRSVEQHLRVCLPCRAALKEEQRLAAALQRDVPIEHAIDRNFERLTRMIERRDEARVSWPARIAASPRAVAASLLLAAVLIGGVSWLALQRGSGPAEYSTATDAAQSGALRIDIVFADGVTEAQIRDLLATLHGTIVGGPTDVGRYTIRLDDPALDERQLTGVIERLQRDPRVRFAGRSFIGDDIQ